MIPSPLRWQHISIIGNCGATTARETAKVTNANIPKIGYNAQIYLMSQHIHEKHPLKTSVRKIVRGKKPWQHENIPEANKLMETKFQVQGNYLGRSQGVQRSFQKQRVVKFLRMHLLGGGASAVTITSDNPVGEISRQCDRSCCHLIGLHPCSSGLKTGNL